MSIRQIILDTETTGISVEDQHKIIEIGCLEMIDRKLTGKSFHYYLNPLREIETAAIQVHGITNEFLKDKPLFSDIAQEFVDFIHDAELIIHNAPFDVSFINYEFSVAKQGWKTVADYCRVIDTLPIARQLHVGQRNSLDALCKRYHVDNSKRDLHGALLDANLLSQVYLAMTGGQGSLFDEIDASATSNEKRTHTQIISMIERHALTVHKANEEELAAHQKYLELLKKQGKCLWLDDGGS